MADRHIRIAVNGATGGLAGSQHLPALLAIRAEGGLPSRSGDRIIPDPLLVGRDERKLRTVAARTGIERWTTDLDHALSDAETEIVFDAASTAGRKSVVAKAIAAGKHVYCEKPISTNLSDAMGLVEAARLAQVKNATVQDKIFLPGFRKLRHLRDAGYFGRILEVRLDFGRWVFDGSTRPAQRPSWNYQKSGGGGLILDMFPHWRYMIERMIAPIQAVSCVTRTQLKDRWDENGSHYTPDVEDSVFAQLELEGEIIASVTSSWCTRVRRDDIITIQVDGTRGSAVAGTQDCYTQPDVNTPAPVLLVDKRQPIAFHEQWLRVPDTAAPVNSYRTGWELFLRHVAEDEENGFPLIEGAKGLQLVELAHRSDEERRWIDVPALQ